MLGLIWEDDSKDKNSLARSRDRFSAAMERQGERGKRKNDELSVDDIDSILQRLSDDQLSTLQERFRNDEIDDDVLREMAREHR